MWVMALFGEAPCQCFSPAGIQTTSPGLIAWTGPPLVCTRPTPEITYSVWPSGCVCQAVRAPGSKETLVGDDDVVGKYRDATAADRLAPADEGQACDRGRRCVAVAPDRQMGAEDTFEIAHHAVGDQCRDPALHHARTQNVAENAGVGDAHGVDHGDASGGHGFDRGAG